VGVPKVGQVRRPSETHRKQRSTRRKLEETHKVTKQTSGRHVQRSTATTTRLQNQTERRHGSRRFRAFRFCERSLARADAGPPAPGRRASRTRVRRRGGGPRATVDVGVVRGTVEGWPSLMSARFASARSLVGRLSAKHVSLTDTTHCSAVTPARSRSSWSSRWKTRPIPRRRRLGREETASRDGDGR